MRQFRYVPTNKVNEFSAINATAEAIKILSGYQFDGKVIAWDTLLKQNTTLEAFMRDGKLFVTWDYKQGFYSADDRLFEFSEFIDSDDLGSVYSKYTYKFGHDGYHISSVVRGICTSCPIGTGLSNGFYLYMHEIAIDDFCKLLEKCGCTK